MSNAHGSKWIRPEKRLAIYLRDGFACVYCKVEAEAGEGGGLSLDHVTPREMGGTHHATNLVTCCCSCNSARQDTPMRAWLQYLRDKGVDTAGVARAVKSSTARKLDIKAGKALLAARRA